MMTVGKKMKEFRLNKDWTLAELAKRSGVALSSLSRIETGRMTGTLESHIKIARALGVRLPELYADLDPLGATIEYRQGDSSDRHFSGKGIQFTLLTKESLRKKMLPAMIHLQAGKASQPDQTAVGIEKFLYLLKGNVEVVAGKEIIRMKPGDSLYLQASVSHSLKNLGSQTASLLSITSPPSL